ncbi:amino acid permease [Glaciihabitans sp. UYNi722]|uniref:amino acid permease n=1 Tax=Glaciihabitans sp. UYNi722 TaxID=3156344 RepID=UPI003399F2C6
MKRTVLTAASEDRITTMPSPEKRGALLRSLSSRHVQFIALGGAIGSGLFYGSAQTIGLAGPGVLIGYLLGGGIVFIVMRALGEMAVAEPVSGSFSDYAHKYVGPFAGFAVGWTYWFSWIVVNIAELTALGIYVSYWFPDMPRWVTALVALLLVVAVNLVSVRAFGETEFWFALVKVLAILGLMAFGVVILVFHLGHGAAVSNLWSDGGILPHGIMGVLLALPFIMFSFGGTELVGITAGEADNPSKTIPKAINQVIVRILIFYVGALLFILMLVPWSKIGLGSSPFVIAFQDVGVPDAAAVLTFVVITAALSAFNSGMYSTGRMLLTLSQHHQAPAFLAHISKRGRVPVFGVLASAAVLSVGVVLNYFLPPVVFFYLSSVATLTTIAIWSMILITQWRFRRALLTRTPYEAPHFPLFWWPISTILGLVGMLLVVVLMAFEPTTRVGLYIAPVWFGILYVSYRVMSRRETRGAQAKRSRR